MSHTLVQQPQKCLKCIVCSALAALLVKSECFILCQTKTCGCFSGALKLIPPMSCMHKITDICLKHRITNAKIYCNDHRLPLNLPDPPHTQTHKKKPHWEIGVASPWPKNVPKATTREQEAAQRERSTLMTHETKREAVSDAHRGCSCLEVFGGVHELERENTEDVLILHVFMLPVCVSVHAWWQKPHRALFSCQCD